MIAAPCIGVVLEHIRRERPQNRFPSRAIPAVVADERIRTRARIWPLIGFARQIDSRNPLRTILRITNRQKLLPDFPQQRVGLSARLDDALTLASADIQVKSVQPQSVSARTAPVHIGKDVA